MITSRCAVCDTDTNLENHHIVPRVHFKADVDYDISKSTYSMPKMSWFSAREI